MRFIEVARLCIWSSFCWRHTYVTFVQQDWCHKIAQISTSPSSPCPPPLKKEHLKSIAAFCNQCEPAYTRRRRGNRVCLLRFCHFYEIARSCLATPQNLTIVLRWFREDRLRTILKLLFGLFLIRELVIPKRYRASSLSAKMFANSIVDLPFLTSNYKYVLTVPFWFYTSSHSCFLLHRYRYFGYYIWNHLGFFSNRSLIHEIIRAIA